MDLYCTFGAIRVDSSPFESTGTISTVFRSVLLLPKFTPVYEKHVFSNAAILGQLQCEFYYFEQIISLFHYFMRKSSTFHRLLLVYKAVRLISVYVIRTLRLRT